MNLIRSTRRHIPSFSLYGEQSGESRQTDPLHIEDIPSRSRKYLWRIGTHRHANLNQCVYVTAGSVAVDLEESHTRFQGPALIIIPSGTVHGFAFGDETQGYVLTMDLNRLLTLASAAHQAPILELFSVPRAIALDADRLLAARAAQLLGALLEEFRQPDSLTAPVSGWLACSVLWMFSAAFIVTTPTGPVIGQDLDRLRRFRLLIESHYLKHWPVERYARLLALSQSSLNRLCQSLTGGTAFDVIQQRLALEARRRLVYVAGSVSAIAAELGFKDAAYFCRFFRKHNGMSPIAFRRHQSGG
jgi:AraC family transcriptional activator of pobA